MYRTSIWPLALCDFVIRLDCGDFSREVLLEPSKHNLLTFMRPVINFGFQDLLDVYLS
jgi:hypothetical protein